MHWMPLVSAQTQIFTWLIILSTKQIINEPETPKYNKNGRDAQSKREQSKTLNYKYYVLLHVILLQLDFMSFSLKFCL